MKSSGYYFKNPLIKFKFSDIKEKSAGARILQSVFTSNNLHLV
jgi:hypothetical protein